MQADIAFIGGGNMATAMIGGLVAGGCARERIRVAEPSAGRAAWLQQEFGVRVAAAGRDVAAGAAAIVLAVKPQQMRAALAGLKPDDGTTIVSIAAGVRLATLQKSLGVRVHYVRTMPNTPALVRKGVTGMYAPAGTPEAARKLAERILQTTGATVWLEREEQMDAVTALSGSGPAYFFLLTEVLREAGEKLGLAPEVAAQLAQQTCIGSAAMINADSDVRTLRAQVTSKGGTTEAAVASLEAAGIRDMFARALAAAARRGGELGDQLERDG
ncbi:MAG TPA: pyrroline-5-carboxylate reductase [Nevskiaceae bacterium]|nr:pyrroline-5-carboxylate reductase [Nevskiaceae bacterium]